MKVKVSTKYQIIYRKKQQNLPTEFKYNLFKYINDKKRQIGYKAE